MLLLSRRAAEVVQSGATLGTAALSLAAHAAATTAASIAKVVNDWGQTPEPEPEPEQEQEQEALAPRLASTCL